MDQIKERIQQTIRNLTEKRESLLEHRKSYNDLKFKLYDLDTLRETDQLKTSINLNSVCRVSGKIKNPRRILAFLGCEYFVERNPVESVKIVENKIKFLDQAIIEFDAKIKEAKKTVENIDQLVMYESTKGAEEMSKVEEVIEGGAGEEALSFMDIREELDEDGNVINSFVEKQDPNALKQLSEKHDLELDDEDAQLQELLRDMEIISSDSKKTWENSKIEEVKDRDSDDDIDLKTVERTVINRTIGDVEASKKVPSKDSKPLKSILKSPNSQEQTTPWTKTKRASISEVAEILPADTIEKTPEVEESDYDKLLKEMGIVSIDSSKGQPTQLLESDIISSQIPPPLSETQPMASIPMIDKHDLLQLQILDSELGEFSDYDDDNDDDGEIVDEDESDDLNNGEFNIEFGHDEDDEDEEDWDFGPAESDLIPGSHKGMFMAELNKLRAEKIKNDARFEDLSSSVSDPITTSAIKEGDSSEKKRKKSVVFAENLEEVKEIENVSQELKKAASIKVSKFKQSRGIFNAFTPSVAKSENHDQDKHPINETVVEKAVSEKVDANGHIGDEEDRAVNEFVVEKDVQVVPVLEVSDTQPKQSRFKSTLKPKPIDKAPLSNEQQNTPEAPEGKPTSSNIKKQSRFKSSFPSKPEPSFIPTPSQKNAIDAHKSIPAKKPHVIAPPKNEPALANDLDLDAIQSYVLQEDEEAGDEELLNRLTDEISVYRGDTHDDEADLDEYDEDDEDYGPMMLDEIVENEDVEDPDYFINDNLIKKEYYDLRKKMIEKYADQLNDEPKERVLLKEEEEQEYEPIDQHGNPVKVSRFRKSLEK